jgi:hypothetical protein
MRVIPRYTTIVGGARRRSASLASLSLSHTHTYIRDTDRQVGAYNHT